MTLHALVGYLGHDAGEGFGTTWPDYTVPYDDFTSDIYLDAGWSSDDPGGTATVTVDWGDGSSDVFTAPNTFGGTITPWPVHTYLVPGSYPLTVTVDGPDGSDTALPGPVLIPELTLTQVERTPTEQSVLAEIAHLGTLQTVGRLLDGVLIGSGFVFFPTTFVLTPTTAARTHLFQMKGYDTAGVRFRGQLTVLAGESRLRQHPRDDALGGTPRQGRSVGASRSVQATARQGWTGAYR